MKRKFKIEWMPLQLLLVLFTIAGCGVCEEKAKTTVKTQDSSSAANGVRASNIDTIEIKEMRFQPATLTVAGGTTVVFVNRDIVTHDVTEETTKAWSSKPLPPLKSWSMIADKSANYYCSIHAVMKGKIVVSK